MTRIVFRDLPPVSLVERQLELHARDRLLDDEVEELPHLIDAASLELFGITQSDTFYWALPETVRAEYGRAEWEEQFDVLGRYTRDPNAHWNAFDLDLRCAEGGWLHCGSSSSALNPRIRPTRPSEPPLVASQMREAIVG